MENTFINSDCPDNLRVRYATSILEKRALTWWNGEKRTRGLNAALSLPWDEFKQIMTAEFCPRSELKKLEAEFWELTQQGGDIVAYTTRFQELSILAPHMVTPVDRAVEKYIYGLPMLIQDTVLGSKPQNLEEAIRLATTLTENHVKAGTLTRRATKNTTDIATTQGNTATAENSITTKPASITAAGTSSFRKKRKAKNYAATNSTSQDIPINPTPLNQFPAYFQPPNKKPYTGTYPQCPYCQLHHLPINPCLHCNNCGRLGHTVKFCHNPIQTFNNYQNYQPNPPQYQPHQQPPRAIKACFVCGDPNHFRNQCPKRFINNINRNNNTNINNQHITRDHAIYLITNQAHNDNDLVGDTF